MPSAAAPGSASHEQPHGVGGVADHGDSGALVHVRLARVEVDPHDRVLEPQRRAPEVGLGQLGPDGEHDVAVVEERARRGQVEPRAERQRVVLAQRALAVDRGEDRGAEPLGEPAEQLRRAGGAAARDDPRPVGGAQPLDRGGDRGGRRARRAGVLQRRQRDGHRLREQVERDLDVARTGPLGPEGDERRGELGRQLVVAHDADGVAGDAAHRARLVAHLVQVARLRLRVGARHARRDHELRDGVRLRLSRGGGGVHDRRAGGGDHDARPAGHARVAVGGVAGALLVARQDVPHAMGFEVRVEREVVRPGDPEDQLHAVRGQAPDDQLATAEGLGHARRKLQQMIPDYTIRK